MQTINSHNAPKAVGPYSHAVKTGNLLLCSGQIPLHPETGALVPGGIEEQTDQVFANVRAVLASAGLSLEHVVKCTVFVTDLADFGVVNDLYARAFGAHKPARSTIQVAALPLGARIEIEVIAEIR